MKLSRLLHETQAGREPTRDRVPYPQANDLLKVQALVTYTCQGRTTQEELEEILPLTNRQVCYYGDAARYLGLVRKSSGNYLPTALGQRLAKSSTDETTELLVRAMLSIPSIRAVFERLADERLTTSMVVSAIRASGVTLRAERTASRRAKTIRAWANWVLAEL